MKRRIVLLLEAAVLALLVPGCPNGIPVTPATLTLTESDNGKTIDVARSDHILIFLPANASTGFTWQQSGGDSTVLKQISQTFVPSMSNVLGGGGVEFLQYDALKVGTTTLTLSYLPPGVGGDATEVFSVTVNVQ